MGMKGRREWGTRYMVALIAGALLLAFAATKVFGSSSSTWSGFPYEMACRVLPPVMESDQYMAVLPVPAKLLIEKVRLNHVGGSTLELSLDFADGPPPTPQTRILDGFTENAAGSIIYTVLVTPPGEDPGFALALKSPSRGEQWQVDVSELDRPQQKTLRDYYTVGNTVKFFLDLEGQDMLLGDGPFRPTVAIQGFGQSQFRGNPFIMFDIQECGLGQSRGDQTVNPPPGKSAPRAASNDVGVADGRYVRTQSGRTRCWVSPETVACEASSGFQQRPNADAVVTQQGSFKWVYEADIGVGDYNDLVLKYGETYDLHGWTVQPSREGTRFTNRETGRGMFVSVENVYSF